MDEAKTEPTQYDNYMAEIRQYEKDAKEWEGRGKKIVKRYTNADNANNSIKRFNILWSNVQTLSPALYAREPRPEVERRHKVADDVSRVASEVLERCLIFTADQEDINGKMQNVVKDRLLPGRGTVWARYAATFNSEQGDDGEPYEVLDYEQAKLDYVHWRDFGHGKARTWDELYCVWRRVYLKREELVERFGETGQTISLDSGPEEQEEGDKTLRTACIYELWDRKRRKVSFLSKSHDKIIEEKDYPINLEGGFPCPKPLYATTCTDSLIPTPDFIEYQTQAIEIESLTQRINALQKALKLVGIYDASAPNLANILGDGYENKMVPVETFAAFAESGGLKGSVDFLPIKEVADVLMSLYMARDKAKEDLYEITGIADIIRGNSDPRETATAQQMKGRFAVLRISDAQEDVQRFARDTLRILGEIIAENFSLETIKKISGVDLLTREEKQMVQMQMQAAQQMQQPPMPGQPPVPQGPPPPPIPEKVQDMMREPAWEDVYELLSNQVLRNFRIAIETDSTIRTDEEADRRERTKFLTSAGTYLRSAIEAAQMAPQMAPLFAELLMFAVRGHKSARQLEPVFDTAMAEMQKPQEKGPDPEAQKLQAELQMKEKEMQLDAQLEREKQQAQSKEEAARQQMEDQRAEREAQREERLQRLEAELEMITKQRVAEIDASAKVQVARETAAIRQPGTENSQ